MIEDPEHWGHTARFSFGYSRLKVGAQQDVPALALLPLED